MSMRNPHHRYPGVPRYLGLSSGQWHFVGGWLAILGCAALSLTILAWIIGVGSTSCPADTGTVPVRTLDGRTMCVVPERGR